MNSRRCILATRWNGEATTEEQVSRAIVGGGWQKSTRAHVRMASKGRLNPNELMSTRATSKSRQEEERVLQRGRSQP
eukprot:CAMPEP_0172529086 /NCGR_PEP_ID=MMETSP1067-20121228/3258_1 /TAXON_ID=265564 ORGANISM="Thalassiosira punctigera, Strain Tpunct2005C2" /NCGR_SAMPLE_ID=MMETSP1067 /ASSEMBLY_ACC=CAM_ASM_000444 /LENGTH=76 /DNA_ID=CAMNT_0013313079 /DNA_START=46 /DNA_END=272 /DNA_ORIENTATION=+